MSLCLLLLALAADPAPESVRAAQRLELRAHVARTNGAWRLHEWGHYFVLTDVRDGAFLEQVERRVFEARALCSRLFPESEADPVRDDRRLAVLRVFKNADEYASFGGPVGSSGHWNRASGEIVIHDQDDRARTWDSLGGCVAYAFLDELFGRRERAAWVEIGLAEFVAESLRSEPGSGPHAAGNEPRLARLGKADPARWPALDTLPTLPRRAWFDERGVELRSAAWSLMRFLCDEEGRGADFDPRWARIPQRCAVASMRFADEEHARFFAFEGVDRAVLEAAWMSGLPGASGGESGPGRRP